MSDLFHVIVPIIMCSQIFLPADLDHSRGFRNAIATMHDHYREQTLPRVAKYMAKLAAKCLIIGIISVEFFFGHLF